MKTTIEELMREIEIADERSNNICRKFKGIEWKRFDGRTYTIKKAIVGYKALDEDGRTVMRNLNLALLKFKMENEFSSIF